MIVDDGGAAFPCERVLNSYGEVLRYEENGMFLRDYFAAKALEGDWASQNTDTGEFSNSCPQDLLENRANLYYRMADAMLKARNQPTSP